MNSVEEKDSSSIDARLMGNLAAANAAWPKFAQDQMLKMVDEIAARNDYIQKITGTNQTIPIKGGFVAEEIHTETFNLDAILQNKTARALTDRDPAWPLGANHPSTDSIVVENGKTVITIQHKNYGTSEATAKAMREVRPDRTQRYDGVDVFVGPKDQVHPTDGTLSIQDELGHTQMRESDSRPHVADAAEYVKDRVNDKIQHDGIESRPTTLDEAREVAKDTPEGKEVRQDYHDGYMDRSTLQQMGMAAAGAAAISAIIAGTLSTAQYLKLVKEGKITRAEAVRGIIKTTAVASADSALKAAAAAGAVSVVTRLAPQLVAQQAMKGMLVRGGVGGAAICAIDAIECMVLVAVGKMTPAQMETRVGKNIFQTGGAVFGSSIGVSVATALGATAGLVPILAGMAGALVAGLAVTIAIENGIEKPYREVIANTTALVAAGDAMRDCAEAMAYGQMVFVGFLVVDADLDQRTAVQIGVLDQLGDDMKKAIQRI